MASQGGPAPPPHLRPEEAAGGDGLARPEVARPGGPGPVRCNRGGEAVSRLVV